MGVNGTAPGVRPATTPPPPNVPLLAAWVLPVPPGVGAPPAEAYGVPRRAGDWPSNERAAPVSRHGVPGTPPPTLFPSRFLPGPGVAATPPLPPVVAGFLMSPNTANESASSVPSTGRYKRSSRRRCPRDSHDFRYAESAAAAAAASACLATAAGSSGSSAGKRAGPRLLSPSPGDSAGCSAESTAFFCAPRADRRPGLEETPPFGDLLAPPPPSSSATTPCTMSRWKSSIVLRNSGSLVFDVTLRDASASTSPDSSRTLMLTMFFSSVLNNPRGALTSKNAWTTTSRW